ncbi:MAG: HEAT repeat domain-containing protein [Elusimicrobia bacterium]|nr:HEAT repeat domain-containing protein [Elusimicrobiota bacterium]
MKKIIFACLIIALCAGGIAAGKNIFKSDTLNYGKGKITRIIRSSGDKLDMGYNGGGFKSFSVSLSEIAGLGLDKLSKRKAHEKRAIAALIYISPKKGVGRYVRELLNDKDVWVRWDVVNILYAVGDRSDETIRKMRKLFNDPCNDIKIKVCQIYGAYASSGEVKAVYSLLWDEDSAVRRQALETLSSRMGNEAVINVAEAMLNDKSFDVRAPALKILFEKKALNEAKICEILIDDDSVEMRRAAAAILFKNGTAKSISALIKAVGDKDKKVSAAAKKALERIRGSSDLPL